MERLDLAMRAINEGVYDWDVAKRRMHYSQGVYSVLKMPRNMKTPVDWRKRIHPDDLAAYDAAIVAHFKKKTKRFECDYRFRATDGTWHWARQRGIALRDADGRAVRMIGSIGDISELKRAEEARRQSDERYAFAMRAINEGVYDWNIAEGRTYYSERVAAAVGLSHRQLKSAADWRERIHPEDRPRYDAALIAHFKGQSERFECDYRYKARDGSWRWARQHGIAVRDASGRAVRMVGSTGDINELKLGEIALRRARDEATEALERQTATSEILKVISGSPTDLQPTFKVILQSTTRLCDSNIAALFLYDGEFLTCAAHHNTTPEFATVLNAMRSLPSRETATRLCALKRAVVRVDDYQNDTRFRLLPSYLREESRSLISVPLLRNGALVGVITTWRREVRPFAGKHIELLKTFADQAVIAIENVRLFNETKEALERQTATAEILRVISGSPTDVQPVFDVIARSAMRLCQTYDVALSLIEDGQFRRVAHLGPIATTAADSMPPIDRSSLMGRSAIDGKTIHVPDVLALDEDEYPRARAYARKFGLRSCLAVPLLREGKAIGMLSLRRQEVAPFNGRQIALVEAFADQAVIAVENVRLFTETKEALERQTATAEILSVIAGSPTDTKPVFDAIASCGARLLRGAQGAILLRQGSQVIVAGYSERLTDDLPREVRVLPLDREKNFPSQVILDAKVMHVPDWESGEIPEFERSVAKAYGVKSCLQVPLLRRGEGIGAIVVSRTTVGPFHDKDIALLKSFADQAVIAIENVRLFNETKEALERQTATAEILKVIASSPSDVQPVFDAIVASAQRLLGGKASTLFRLAGDTLHIVALSDLDSATLKSQPRSVPAARGVGGEALRTLAPVYVADIENDSGIHESTREVARARGFRSLAIAPLVREGAAVGLLTVGGAQPDQFNKHQLDLLKTFADQAVIAIENVRLFNETKESLEQQTAISEVLRVISGSPTDVKPVLEAVAVRAAKICDASDARIFLVEGEALRHWAGVGDIPAVTPVGDGFALSRGTSLGRAVIDRSVVHIRDMQTESADEYPAGRDFAERTGFRTVLTVPLMREDHALGGIVLRRLQVRPFTDKQIALLKTFADQAAIAIENVRLFNETKEALEQQQASAEVLRVISKSVADTRPVFDAIAQCCERLFHGFTVGISVVGDDGLLHLGAYSGPGQEEFERMFPMPLNEETGAGRAITSRKVLHYPDSQNGADVPEYVRRASRATGSKAIIFAPMLLEDRGIGAIYVARASVGSYSPKEIALLQSFADQAVIAIENVRLFNETRESLERQTATAEILRVIASSPSDVQPVFDAIAESAKRLLSGHAAVVARRSGDMLHLAAYTSTGKAGDAALKRMLPAKITGQGHSGKAILTAAPVLVADVETDPDYSEAFRANARARGFRSIVSVPMLREGEPIGVISVYRPAAGKFSEHQTNLLKTFADQAVIAIENVRLFNETKEALERQTATAEILKVISSSPTDVQPVFEAIAERAATLSGARFSFVTAYDGDWIHLRATCGPGSEEHAANYPIKPGSDAVAARVVRDRAPVQIQDVLADPAYAHREFAERTGYRSVFGVPMMHEGRVLGAITLARPEAGATPPELISLLQTFADQAVIAIENVRLFNETKEALEKQTATADILQVLSGSPSDTQPVFDAIVRHAARLCESTYATVFRYDGERIHLAASHGASPGALAALRDSWPAPPNRRRVVGRVIESGHSIRVEDTLADADYDRGFAGTLKLRRLLGVPLVRGGRPVGAITVGWAEPGPVRPRHEDLLKTFADQAVIAIENVRLFNETKEALERQTATGEILRVISQSPTDTRPVFEAIVQSGIRLFAGAEVLVGIVDGGELCAEAAAGTGISPVGVRVPVSRESAGGIAILERKVVNIRDTEAPDAPPYARENGRRLNVRSMTHAPMFREGEAIGTVTVLRREPGGLDDKQLALLKTFADQAVIAIENVRLFKELQARTEALTKSVGQLTALGEVGQAISSTLDLETVLKTIVARAVQLTGLDGGSIYEYDERSEQFSLQASQNIEAELVEAVRKTPVRKGEGAIGRCAVTLEPAQVADITEDSYHSGRKEILVRAGYRAVLAVPLLREDHMLGALQVFRRTPGVFAPEIVELLQTFATQSAMAIQNARLFREIEEKGKQLEVASRHKSDFLASMSHELRTPLNAILGFNEMILGQVYGEVPKDMQEPLADIQTSGKHLLRLINNVLDLAKIEAGRMELALADYSVHDTVESVRSTLRPLAADKGLEFLASVPNDIPLAHGDGGRITQCLMNLAGNSLKFTKAGKVEISVALRDGTLRYSVADTGIGIPPDKIGSLFTEFKQTDATIASEYGGTGLGLSISRKFVEMHGGRIWVESEIGKGSAFIFEIPLRATS